MAAGLFSGACTSQPASDCCFVRPANAHRAIVPRHQERAGRSWLERLSLTLGQAARNPAVDRASGWMADALDRRERTAAPDATSIPERLPPRPQGNLRAYSRPPP